MAGLSDKALIDLWDKGTREHPLDRALTLLSAQGAHQREDLARLPIDQRDARLFGLAADWFGPMLRLKSTCTVCEGETELDVRVQDVLATIPADRTFVFAYQGMEHPYRLPTSLDLADALRRHEAEGARYALLSSLLTDIRPDEAMLTAFESHLGRQCRN